MKKLVYLETTIFSFYHDEREQSNFRQLVTQEWWNSQKKYYDLCTSIFTLQELNNPAYPNWESTYTLAEEIPVLNMHNDIPGIIRAYIDNKVMPQDDTGDAAHLAIASHYSVDFLLTWNCKHIANANKFEHIQKINRRLGLLTPILLTPEMLFMEN